MCGLVGVFGVNTFMQDEDFFNQGMIASQVRGQDSAGMAIIYGQKLNSKILKAAQDSTAFVARHDVQSIFKKHRDIKIMMGHTRYATSGTIVDKNSHPFEHEHIILAHNGGVWNKKDLPDGDKFDVDSEAICHSVAKIGAIETLRKINGAFALSYFDFDEQRFNLIRNDGRPLFWAKHKHRNVYYYASEGEMLLWLLRRNKIDLEVSDENRSGIHLLEESHLASFDMKEEKFEIRKVNYEKRVHVSEPYNKTHWHQPTGRESDDKEDKSPPYSGSTGDIGRTPTSNVTPIDIRRRLLLEKSIEGPHGLGVEYLQKWNLRFHDTVCVYVPDIEPVTAKSHHYRGLAYFGGKDAPDCDIWVYGFSEQDYRIATNGHGRYLSKVQSCYWDSSAKNYVIVLSGIFSTPPPGRGVVIPKDLKGIFKTPEIKPEKKPVIRLLDNTENQPILPALPAPPAIEPTFTLADDDVLTEAQLEELADKAAQEHAALEESFRKKEERQPGQDDEPDGPKVIEDLSELVLGPHGSKITLRRWLEETKDGCGYCTSLLYTPETTDWVGTSPVHKDCTKIMEYEQRIMGKH